MSSHFANTNIRQGAPDHHTTVQKLLDENSLLIAKIKECHTQSRPEDAVAHQHLLHRNLTMLARAADQSLLPLLRDDASGRPSPGAEPAVTGPVNQTEPISAQQQPSAAVQQHLQQAPQHQQMHPHHQMGPPQGLPYQQQMQQHPPPQQQIMHPQQHQPGVQHPPHPQFMYQQQGMPPPGYPAPPGFDHQQHMMYQQQQHQHAMQQHQQGQSPHQHPLGYMQQPAPR